MREVRSRICQQGFAQGDAYLISTEPWRHSACALKVIGSRPDTLIENFRTLLPTGTGADFRRILDLKVLTGFGICASATPAIPHVIVATL